MGEKRAESRLEWSLPCRLQWDGKSYKSHTVNLSLGGAGLRMDQAGPAVGTEVDLILVGRELLRLKGQVKHSEGTRVGMEFAASPDHARYCVFLAERL